MRIAIVDDHEGFRASLVRLLAIDTDIEVVALGASAADAVEIAATIDLDAIVLDWQLPDDTGSSAAATIAARHGPPKIVLLTGYATVSVTRDALAAGCDEVVSKDKAAMTLADVLRRLCDGAIDD